LYSLLRVLFFALFRASAAPVAAADLRTAFALGARFDLRLALWLAVPPLAWGWIGPLRAERPLGARLPEPWIPGAGALVTLVYFCDIGHYDYLHARLAAQVLDELRSREALGMIWESYPVVPGLLALALAALGWLVLARGFLARARRPWNTGSPS